MSRRSTSPIRGGGILRARHLTAGLALGLALGTVGFASPASATPQSDLASQKAQAQHLAAQIEENSNRAEMLDAQYQEAQSAVDDANHQIASAEAGIASARAQEAALRKRLGGRAALLYMGAGSSDPLGINASSVQELGARAKYSAAAAETDDRMISRLTILDEQLRIQTNDLQKQKSEAQKRQNDADNARRQVEAANSKLQSLLSTTNADIKSLANKIEVQRIAAEAAAEKARIQAEAAAAGGSRRGDFEQRRRRAELLDELRRHRHRPREPSRAQRRRGGRDRVRPRADRKALRLRRRRPELVRLLRPHDDGLGPGRGLDEPRLAVAMGVVPESTDPPAPAGRPRLLRVVGSVEPPRRALHRRRHHDRGAAHRYVRAVLHDLPPRSRLHRFTPVATTTGSLPCDP